MKALHTVQRTTKDGEVRNVSSVPQRQWRKWSKRARQVFNAVYDFAVCNPTLCIHKKMDAPKPEHWKVTSWNLAWIAADAVDDELPDEIQDV